MQRRTVVLGFSAIGGAILTGCGGGGESLYAALPAWSKGTNAVAHEGTSITVSFDLTKGYLLGLYTTKVVDGKEESDPVREVLPSQVDRVVYASPTVGGVAQSRAFAPWDATGTVIIRGVPEGDSEGRIYVVLKPVGGVVEAIALQLDPDPGKSKFAVTGDMVVNGDNSLSYGHYRLGRLGFLSGTRTLRCDVGSDIPSAGFNGYAALTQVVYAQWNCNDTGWLADGLHRFRSLPQVDTHGQVFFDFERMPLNSQGTISLHLSDGTDLWFYPKSKRWETLGELTPVVVNDKGDEHLRYGDYQKGRIFMPTPGTLEIDFAVDLLHSLAFEVAPGSGRYVLADVSPEQVSRFYWFSQILGWSKTAAVGSVSVDPVTGYYRAVIAGLPMTGDRGWIKVVLTDGSELAFNPLSTRFAGSSPAGVTIR
jgi:hypothetical protein